MASGGGRVQRCQEMWKVHVFKKRVSCGVSWDDRLQYDAMGLIQLWSVLGMLDSSTNSMLLIFFLAWDARLAVIIQDANQSSSSRVFPIFNHFLGWRQKSPSLWNHRIPSLPALPEGWLASEGKPLQIGADSYSKPFQTGKRPSFWDTFLHLDAHIGYDFFQEQVDFINNIDYNNDIG